MQADTHIVTARILRSHLFLQYFDVLASGHVQSVINNQILPLLCERQGSICTLKREKWGRKTDIMAEK